MKRINSNMFFYIYLSVGYIFSLWLVLFIISDLKIVYLLIVALIIIIASVGQVTYVILSYPTLYQTEDSLKITRPFRANVEIKLTEIISLEKVRSSFMMSPSPGPSFIKRYKIVARENGVEQGFSFYDTFSNGRNISEFAAKIKMENPFFRNEL